MDFHATNNNNNEPNNNTINRNISIVAPYIHRLGEKFKKRDVKTKEYKLISKAQTL